MVMNHWLIAKTRSDVSVQDSPKYSSQDKSDPWRHFVNDDKI